MSDYDDTGVDTTNHLDKNSVDPSESNLEPEPVSISGYISGEEIGEEVKKTPNPLRCPFAPRTESMKQNLSRNTKRTQRYRSTAQSRLGDMTVGDIRYCFQQLRNAGENLNSDMILYNGQCAGEFALQYLQETSNATKKRRKSTSSKTAGTESENTFTQMEFPSSQLVPEEKRHKTNNEKTNVLEF